MNAAADLVALRGVCKRYGAVRALDDVSFTIRRGEVHALLGENGAGKSTAMRVVKGETRPDSGAVLVDGVAIERFSPATAKVLGIAMVHQELSVFDDMSVAENILPDLPTRTRLGLVDRAALTRRAAESLALFGLRIDPSELIRNLTLGQQQIVEILRAISGDIRLIILDEPTSSLNAHETTVLLGLIKRLRADGKSVLFVSHRIPEVLEISDRITVLRDGRYVETLDNRGLTERDLVTRMVGRDLAELYAAKDYDDLGGAKVAFEARGLAREGGIHDVDVAVARGEVLGIFGLDGSGTTQLSRVLFGLDEAKAGTLAVAGRPIAQPSPERLIAAGVTYLHSDRKRAGLFMNRSIADNIGAPVIDRLSRAGMLDRGRARALADRFMQLFAIKAPSPRAEPRTLSGGNQQKVMMAACLSPEPDVIIVNEPTRGVDVGAKAEMHRALRDLARAGKAVIAFSSEMPELITLADRIVVMRNNMIVGECVGRAISEEAVMTLAAGSDRPDADRQQQGERPWPTSLQ